MTRGMESCLGCGQMLVAVPAGGGWAHLSLALPVSLLSAVEEATDGVRRFCFFQSSSLPPRPDGKGPAERVHGSPARPPGPPPTQGSTVYRVGSPCLPPLPQTLCCLPVDTSKTTSPSIDLSAGISSLRQNLPSQGLSALKTIKTGDFVSAHLSLRGRARGRDAKLEMLYILMWFFIIPGEHFGCILMHVDCVTAR